MLVDKYKTDFATKVSPYLSPTSSAAYEGLQIDEKSHLRFSAKQRLKAFDEEVERSATNPLISTGFKGLDDALGGGLYPSLYTLGAMPGAGKTSLVLQTADNVAKSGNNVLILSLEMSAHSLMGRSISRLTYELAQDKSQAKTYRDITDGRRYEQYSDEELNLIKSARAKYEHIANHIYIYEGKEVRTLDSITEVIKGFCEREGGQPLIIVDYVQIIEATTDRSSDKQNVDKAVYGLVDISHKYALPVLMVSSINRASYSESEKPIGLSSFKESGAIEFASDVVMSLQFKARNGLDSRISLERSKRDIELVFLKNRNASLGEVVNLKFVEQFTCFEEETRWETN